MLLEDLESKTSKEIIHLLACISELKISDYIPRLIETPELAYEALLIIKEASSFPEIVEMASNIPRCARLIISDLPQYRTEYFFKKAIGQEKDWALKYKKEYDLDYSWLNKLLQFPTEELEVSI